MISTRPFLNAVTFGETSRTYGWWILQIESLHGTFLEEHTTILFHFSLVLSKDHYGIASENMGAVGMNGAAPQTTIGLKASRRCM